MLVHQASDNRHRQLSNPGRQIPQEDEENFGEEPATARPLPRGDILYRLLLYV